MSNDKPIPFLIDGNVWLFRSAQHLFFWASFSLTAGKLMPLENSATLLGKREELPDLQLYHLDFEVKPNP